MHKKADVLPRVIHLPNVNCRLTRIPRSKLTNYAPAAAAATLSGIVVRARPAGVGGWGPGRARFDASGGPDAPITPRRCDGNATLSTALPRARRRARSLRP